MVDAAELDLLQVAELTCGYTREPIVTNLSFSVRAGEVVALIGHNGSGKSTLLSALAGVVPWRRGTVTLNGSSTSGLSPRSLVRSGVVFVPQSRNVFSALTVSQNVRVREAVLTASPRSQKTLRENAVLAEREHMPAGQLSGGQRQMLAMVSALAAQPKLLLVDEPSAGLSGKVAAEAFKMLRAIADARGVGVLVVEHRVREVFGIADRVVVLRRGQRTYYGDPVQLDHDKLRELYL